MTLNHRDNEFYLFSCHQSHRTATRGLVYFYSSSSLHYPVVLLSLGVLLGPMGYPAVLSPKGIKMGHLNMDFLFHICCLYVNLDSKRLGDPSRILEDQIYINFSQKHSNIGLEAYCNVIT